jgi:hypothetical protein
MNPAPDTNTLFRSNTFSLQLFYRLIDESQEKLIISIKILIKIRERTLLPD